MQTPAGNDISILKMLKAINQFHILSYLDKAVKLTKPAMRITD